MKKAKEFLSDFDEVACDWWKVESRNPEKPKHDEIGRRPNNRLGVMMNDGARRIVLRLFACMLSTHSQPHYVQIHILSQISIGKKNRGGKIDR